MREFTVNYLNKKLSEMIIQHACLIAEKNELRDSGKYRKITSANADIVAISTRMKSSQLMIDIVSKLNFENSADSVRDYLSPYGVFCDRVNFYYDEKILNKYNDDHKIQIIMCEIFNSLQDYFVKGELSDKKKLKCRGRSLTCLYSVGVIEEYSPLYNYEEERIIEAFYKKYPLVKIITYPPNEKAAMYLFNKLIWDEDVNLGDIVERWEFCDSLTITIQPKKLYNTERDGIELRNAPLENRIIYYVKSGEEYIRTTAMDPIIIKNRDAIKVTKKLIE